MAMAVMGKGGGVALWGTGINLQAWQLSVVKPVDNKQAKPNGAISMNDQALT